MHPHLEKIVTGLDAVRAHCRNVHAKAPVVSQWSIGEHADHIAKSNSGIYGHIVLNSTSQPVGTGISLIGRVSLMTKWIPRGKGKAPERLHPGKVEAGIIDKTLEDQRNLFLALEADMEKILQDKKRYKHPVFGGLSKQQWLVFIDIHQRHHLKIIADIAAASPSA